MFNEIFELINEYADQYGIPRKIVYGVCKKESAFDQFACRFEPAYRWLFQYDKVHPPICSHDTEKILQMTSIGLMQVMGGVYREYGYKGWLSALFASPEQQIMYGCRHLAGKIKKYGLTKGIAAYNSGSPIMINGRLKNQDYVDDVLAFAEEYQG
jgi:soluble lytic murein transglycosylase-like protein